MKEDPDHSEEKVSVNQPQEKKPAGRPKLIKNNKSEQNEKTSFKHPFHAWPCD